MKTKFQNQNEKTDFTRIDRIVLHLRCLVRDHQYVWHLAGVWREVTFH